MNKFIRLTFKDWEDVIISNENRVYWGLSYFFDFLSKSHDNTYSIRTIEINPNKMSKRVIAIAEKIFFESYNLYSEDEFNILWDYTEPKGVKKHATLVC